MKKITEQLLGTQLDQLRNTSQLCNGKYPNVKLSDCATTALKDFIDICIYKNRPPSTGVSKNYHYLIDILIIIHSNPTLLNESDNSIWQLYINKNKSQQLPKSNHQIPGVAKAIIRAKLFPCHDN